MAKTSLGANTEQQLKKLFVESLNGGDTLVLFGRVTLADGKATLAKPDGMADYQVFVQETGATPTGYTYSVEYKTNTFIIHSSNSGDTTKISYLIIGN
jgi:hypothetical protein